MAEEQKIVSCTGQGKDAHIYSNRIYWHMIKNSKNYIRSKLVNNVENYPNYEEDLIQLKDGNIQGYNFVEDENNNLHLFYSVDNNIYTTIFDINFIPTQIDTFLFNGTYPQVQSSNFLNGKMIFFYLTPTGQIIQMATKDYLNFYGMVNLSIQRSWPTITKFDIMKDNSGKYVFTFETI